MLNLQTELTERSTHRAGVVTKNEKMLAGEVGEVDRLRQAETNRRRKIERARRRLEKIRNDNLSKERLIEK